MQKRRGRPPKSAQPDTRNDVIDLLKAEIDALRFNLTKAQAVVEYLEHRMALIRTRYEDTSI